MHGLLKNIVEGNDLTADEAESFLLEVMRGKASHTLVASIIASLRTKGEAVPEIIGFLRAMRANMITVEAPGAMDIVGTGGDGAVTFNISTTSAFVVAGAGVKVAKHGNRAASSKCGSADVLEALGAHIELTKEQAETIFRKTGFVFLMAPLYHPALKEVGAVRRELKIRTIFNVLGPFANPAGTERQLVGVPGKDLAKTLAEVAKRMKYERMMLVSSNEGLDEIALSGTTHLFDVRSGRIRHLTIDPRRLGFKSASARELQGGDATENTHIIRTVLSGKGGSRRDVVVLNSAFALIAAGTARTPREAIDKAKLSIDSGAALGALDTFVRATQEFA